MLAFSPQDVVQHVVRGPRLESVTQHTILDPKDFLAELKRVRSAGIAYDRGEGSILAVCIGAPILDDGGNAIAAMSISGPTSRFNPKKDSPVIASLMKATTELTRTFGQMSLRR
ncbi:MAG: IclR family transcriptional regulator C-terminal domain-containing protein [Edaphobacter sp.]